MQRQIICISQLLSLFLGVVQGYSHLGVKNILRNHIVCSGHRSFVAFEPKSPQRSSCNLDLSRISSPPSSSSLDLAITSSTSSNSRRRRRSSMLSMHMGHHHGHDHHGHSHGHGHDHDHPETAVTGLKGLVQYFVSVIKSKRQTILGVVLGAAAIVAVRSYRGVNKFSSTDIGILGLVTTFVLAVETTKAYLTSLQERVARVAAAWRHHRSLRLLQSDRPLAAGGPVSNRMAAGAKEADRVTWLGIYANLFLFIVKAAAGVLGRSAAMIADAGHTLSDLVSDAVTLWAVRMSALPPDEDHPYGHGRFEAVAPLVSPFFSSPPPAIYLPLPLHTSYSMGSSNECLTARRRSSLRTRSFQGSRLPRRLHPFPHHLLLSIYLYLYTPVTLWAVRMSALPPDEDHPYGHGRFEAVGSLGVSILLLITAWHIAAHSYDKLQHCLHLSSFPVFTIPWDWLAARGGHVVSAGASCSATPSLLAVGAALASIIIKELLYQITASVGLKHNSQVLLANAWHHRSDAISSVMALGGIVAARAGLSALDPMAGILVTAMIGLTGMQIFLDSMNQLTDTVESDAIPGIQAVAASVEGVMETSDIRARRMGPQMLVDLRIRVARELSASAAQQVADQVRWRIRRDFPTVSEVLVHLKTETLPCPVAGALGTPSEIEQTVRTQIETKLDDPRVTSIGKVTVHYVRMQATVEVLVKVEPSLTVEEASTIAKKVQALIEGVKEVTKADVHLDLTGMGPRARIGDEITAWRGDYPMGSAAAGGVV